MTHSTTAVRQPRDDRRRRSGPRSRVAPGPRSRGLGGSLPDFRRDKIGFLMRVLHDHGPVVRFRFGPKTIHLLWHPDHVKQVLGDGYLNFEKASRGFNKLKLLLGNGLVTSDGSFWQRQRRIAQPAFHHQRIGGFADTMTAAAEETAGRWAAAAELGEPVAVYPEMSRLTFSVVVRTLLGTDLPAGAFETVNRGLAVALEHMNHNIYRLLDVPGFLPTRRNREFRAAVAAMDEVVYRIIERRRREEPGAHRDLLAMLMSAEDEETGERMADEHLRDEVMTIMLAGHETTAIALTWTWYLLSTHPDVRRRLESELGRVLGGRPPAAADVPELAYTTQVVHEALRLYPPLWAFSRRVRDAFELGGYDVPAGSTLFLSPYLTHRHPEVWENPEGFDPERFAPAAPRHPKYAFLPFGGGPRNCIGGGFAVLEMQMVLAALVQRFRLDLVPGHRVDLHPILTLRPSTDVVMSVQPRG